jgi:hemerythrin HHE cation binding domain-containing protein
VGGGIGELPVTPQGEALYEDLLWVHGLLRQDLATVERLAVEVVDGAPAEGVVREVRALETTGPLWRLRASCLHYCRFVHHHHRLEDRALFPELRRVNPALGPVVDRLQEDHRRVALLLEAVEAAVETLDGDGTAAARLSVASALEALAGHLLAHLELEEESVAETLRRWEPQRP